MKQMLFPGILLPALIGEGSLALWLTVRGEHDKVERKSGWLRGIGSGAVFGMPLLGA